MDGESTAKGKSQVRILMAATIIFPLPSNFLKLFYYYNTLLGYLLSQGIKNF